MPDFEVRLEQVPPQGLFRIDVKNEIFSNYTLMGFMSLDRIRGRLDALTWRPDDIDDLMKRIVDDGGQRLRFHPRLFESYQEFYNFWNAGIPPRRPAG